MSAHTGPGHPDVTLGLSEDLPDGGILHQSWNVCGCSLDRLRAMLGAPQQQSYATREQVAATAAAVLSVSGTTHLGEGL